MTTLFRSLCLGGLLAVASAAAGELRLHVEAKGFRASEEDITRLLQNAARELYRHFPDYELEPILVVRGRRGPITLYDRNPRNEIVVQLDTRETLWSQYSYQWSHELCHILCRHRPEGRENKWFEETLCELASLYVMRRMSESWAEDPPYPHWADYRHALRKYVDDVTASRTPLDLAGLAEFYREHESELRRDPALRELNGAMAVALLPLLEAAPEHWEAIRWLNAFEAPPGLTFESHLLRWREAAPAAHRGFITQLAAAFGLRLPPDDHRPPTECPPPEASR